MKITKAGTEKIKFKNLKIGTVFKLNDCYFMKIENLDVYDKDFCTANAISLEHGMAYYFSDFDEVELVEYDFIVK